MYDKKTWVILTICGSLLATNFYYMNKNQQAQAELRAREEALQKVAELGKDPASTTTAGLTVETLPPPTEEQLIVLQNEKNRLHPDQHWWRGEIRRIQNLIAKRRDIGTTTCQPQTQWRACSDAAFHGVLTVIIRCSMRPLEV